MMKFNIDNNLKEKIKNIELLVLDVDGVLTNGWLIYDSKGGDLRCFDSQDGTGMLLLKAMGINTVLITIRPSKPIKRRAEELGMELYVVMPKEKVLDEILRKYHATLEEICYVGDDIADLGIMKKIGFPVAVANATPVIKEISSYITEKPGGSGAVREVTDLILKVQGKFDKALKANIDPRHLKRIQKKNRDQSYSGGIKP
jgi:3-deoxy-D-manno-octulosonate 8-phosphate phosphatase (KDO 8-P phosphatase)